MKTTDECVIYSGEFLNEFIDNENLKSQLINLLDERSVVGIEKYNTTLKDNDLTNNEKWQHLLEENLDAMNYISKLYIESTNLLQKVYLKTRLANLAKDIERDSEMKIFSS